MLRNRTVLILILLCPFLMVKANCLPMESGCTPPPAPTNTTSAANLTRCTNQNTTLSVSGTGTIGWYSAATGGTYLAGGSTYTTPLLTANVTYYVQDSTCAASTTRLAITVTVNARPTLTVTSSSNSVCDGSAVTLGCTGAASYFWTPVNLSGSSITFVPLFSNIYTVTGTAANGCTNTATRIITVNPVPTVSSTTTSGTICQGQSTSMTASGASFYNWFPGSLSGTSVTVTPAATTTYTIVGVDFGTACTSTSTRTITVNPQPTITTTASNTSICLGNSTQLSASGGNTYLWNPGALSGAVINVSPFTTTTYTVTGTNANGCTRTATRTITVTPPCSSVLNLKVFIQGYYAGLGLMSPVLSNQGVAGATSLMCDTITVQLRQPVAPYAIAHSIKTILNTNGSAVCNFPISGNYYIAVQHRNGLQTWSANPVNLVNGTPANYDFSNLASKAYGGNQVNVAPGVFAMFSGDINMDENIDIADLSIQEIDIVNFASGYLASDLTGEGNVDILDAPVLESNVNNFIFSVHP